MKNILILTLITFTQLSFGQNVFKERDESLADHFVASDILQDNTVGDRYSKLTRADGYIINQVTKMGSVFTKRLHRTGKVIFNSEAGDYLNSIKSSLLTEYPKLDDLINVYVTENATLNAFATVNNNIYVNIGLLARIENEAQLAFIISHEIMHIVNAHIVNQSLDVNEKAEEYGKGDLAIDDDIIQLYRHELSQEHETEADVDGFTLFLKHKYDIGEGRKALKMLEKANDYNIDIPVKDQILFITDTTQYVELLKNHLESVLKKNAKKDKEDELRTHPLLEQRLEQIEDLYAEVDESEYNGIQYVISEERFKRISEQAKNEINRIFAEDLDFISLFLYSSARLVELEDNSDENLNYLGYALQGLLIDKVKEFEAGEARSTNPADSLFSYFYKKSKKDEFYKWSYDAITSLEGEFNQSKLKSYKNGIIQTIVNQDLDSAEYVFGEDHANIDMTKMDNINGLNINELSFNVTPWADMSRKQINSFNETKKHSDATDGKVAVVTMNNVKIRKDKVMSMNYYLDIEKVEELDSRTDQVWLDLEANSDDRLVSLIPNPLDYNGEEYEIYDKLNQWMGERLYFNNYYYVSIHEDDITDIMTNEDIRYALSSLNIEIKAFSMKSFILLYFSPFAMFHYVPQLIVNTINASTRKYQLTLIYDLENGELKFWDKKTYVDPSSKAQFQLVYNKVIKDFLNE